MSNRLSVVLNGHKYTRRGATWVDATGKVVPPFLCPALDAALGTSADSRTKGPANKGRAGSHRGSGKRGS